MVNRISTEEIVLGGAMREVSENRMVSNLGLSKGASFPRSKNLNSPSTEAADGRAPKLAWYDRIKIKIWSLFLVIGPQLPKILDSWNDESLLR